MKMILPPKCLACILSVLSLFLADQAVAAPRITCDAPRYDFGVMVGQKEVVHEFVLQNRGDENLIILEIKNCCGVSSIVEPMAIPPGSNAVCRTVFNAQHRYGPQDKQILLVTNDRKNIYFDLRLVGTLLKAVEFSPRVIQLGDLLPDSSVMEILTVTNLLNKVVMLDSVSTTIKGLETKVVHDQEPSSAEGVEADDADSVRSWTVQLKSVGSLPLGRISGQIRLELSTGAVEVPVIGSVKPFVQATPELIRFSAVSDRSVERLVMLRSGDGRAFTIESAELVGGEGSISINQLSTSAWEAVLDVVPSSLQAGACLHIKTSCNAQSVITIPLEL